MLPVTCVRSIAGDAIDHKVWDRLLVTAPESPRRCELAMAARAMHETQVYMECARSLLIRSITEVLDH